MGNSSSDTYQPDFMKHIRQQQQYSAPPPSVTASTSAPPTSSVSTPYHEDMSGMDTIKPAARTPSTVSSPNSAAVAAADAAIAAAKRKLPQSASVSQSSGAKVGNPVLSPPVPRQSRQASDGSLPPAPQQEKPVPPAPHPTMLPRAQSTSVDDLRELLGELEANMEREIQATRLRYEIRKAPILDAILAKGGRLPFKEGIPERRGAASKEG
ncbi:hypothetical protein HK101_011284 [Irineochytrium annulatum]|nr:hypothetical protein HK101_011284 [Irineochytrium annulatum]